MHRQGLSLCVHDWCQRFVSTNALQSAFRKLVVGPLAERLAQEHKGTFTLRITSGAAGLWCHQCWIFLYVQAVIVCVCSPGTASPSVPPHNC